MDNVFSKVLTEGRLEGGFSLSRYDTVRLRRVKVKRVLAMQRPYMKGCASTFTFTRDTSYTASILFTLVKSTCEHM